ASAVRLLGQVCPRARFGHWRRSAVERGVARKRTAPECSGAVLCGLLVLTGLVALAGDGEAADAERYRAEAEDCEQPDGGAVAARAAAATGGWRHWRG